LLQRYGEPIRQFIERRLTYIAVGGALAIIAVYGTIRYLLR
jgi:hypothetical protein